MFDKDAYNNEKVRLKELDDNRLIMTALASLLSRRPDLPTYVGTITFEQDVALVEELRDRIKRS